MIKAFTHSVVSNAKLEPLFSLGDIYVSDFLKKGENPKYNPCPIELAFDPVSKLVQLTKQPCNEAMWGSFYWYLSATNPQMRLALKDLAEKTVSCISDTKKSEIYLDIASNDGTLLSFLDKNKYHRVGIDPSKYEGIGDKSDLIIQDYFSATAYKKYKLKKVKFASCAAMLYDLEKPNEFLRDVYDIMEDDGIFTVQLSYTPLMLLQLELGNLCHEHLCYYNLTSLKYLFEKNGFIIKDLELNNVNGGSIRLYTQKKIAPNNFKSPSDKDICDIRINSLLEWEENNGYNTKEKYLEFFAKINELRDKTVNFIKEVKKQGKSVYGYGASTKAGTLYQYFGLDNTLIDKISEKQERKVGLMTVGTNIPIISDEQMRKEKPDYLLVGPWFFLESFKEREKEYLRNGGKFILTSPKFEIYS